MNEVQKKFYAKKAVRRGKIFCAPWCGRGCTVAEYNRAVAKSKSLLKMLNAIGGTWKPRVWENMGWHYSVGSPDNLVKVYEYVDIHGEPSSYSIFVSHEPSEGGSFVGKGKTLRAALKDAHARATADLDDAQRAFNATKKALGAS